MSLFVKRDEAPMFNFIYRSFAPIAFITLVSSLLYTLKLDWIVKDIYYVVIYYFLFRLIFNIFTGRTMLLNWSTQIAYILVSVPTSYYVYNKLILDKQFLFPSANDIGNVVWIGIIGYLYTTLNNINLSDIRSKKRKTDYLENRYLKYKNLYGKIIEKFAHNKEQEMLIYSVLIYEAFNRPKVYRIIENILFLFGFAKTLGIMQVNTDKYINDKESVSIGARKIVADYEKAKLEIEQEKNIYNPEFLIRRLVLKKYNPDDDYINEVNDLYFMLVKNFTSKVKDVFEKYEEEKLF